MDTGNQNRSCVITIVPNVTTRTAKKIAVLPVTGYNGNAVNVTVNYIKIGNYTTNPIFPISATHPGGGIPVGYSVTARGFSVPVIPGQNIQISLTLNAQTNVGVALAMEN
jgi:hypothetical protein